MPLLDNAPATFDIQTIANADLGFTVSMKDSANADVNFTGYAIVMQVKDSKGITVAELSTTNGRITIATTVVTFHLPATANPAPQSYRYDIVFTSVGGAKIDPLFGNFIVLPAITA